MKIVGYIALVAVLILASSCKKKDLIKGGNGLDDWNEETHGYGATPDYDIVFNQTEVQRLDFVIESDYWTAMQEDITTILGSGGAPGTFSEESPMYVPMQMYFNGKQWYDVGVRYKGNSSLQSSYNQGNNKLPFRIEMNHFENENPNINGQTFYGFQQLALSSNFKDDSYLHEKVASDVFRDFGIPAPKTAFYRIYVDHGKGPQYFGLYTMVEVVFDPTMLNRSFGNSSGNCYKPDGDGSRLNDPTAVNETYFPLKSGSDYSRSDITQLIDALLASTRTSNPSQWRSDLEEILDMDMYLKYLAANTTMQNWDTYGRMRHNYYLYHNPNTNKFVWIPWDNNETFSDGPGGGGGGMTPLEFDFSSIATSPQGPNGDVTWPLISYVYADPVYKAQYDAYIDQFIQTSFSVSSMTQRFNAAHDLIAPYVTGNDGEVAGYTNISSASAFNSSVSTLVNFVTTRWTEADNYTP